MTETSIQAIVMPKWGLAMTEGMVSAWLVEEGSEIAGGDELLEIETTKITNVLEASAGGTLRRRVAEEGGTLPVGALLGVLADPAVADAAIDAFIDDFRERFAAAEAEAAEVEPEPQSLVADGQRFRYLEMGAGEDDQAPVLFLHGFGADLNNWMFNQPALVEQGHRALALDLPGHGGSGKELADPSLAGLADAVAGFMAAVLSGPVHLVGHSLGGAIALHLAQSLPGQVASLTLICPAGLGPEIDGGFITGFIEGKRGKHLKPVLEMLVQDPSLISRDMVEDVLKFKRLDGAQAALAAIAEASFPAGRQAADLRAALDGLAPPVQVIWGQADRIVPASQAENLPETVTVRVLEGAGHMPHMEKAAEVNRLILDFLAS